MGMIADLFVKLGLKKEGFDKGIDDAKKKGFSLGESFKKLGGVLVGVFALEKIKAFTLEAVKMAGAAQGIESAFKHIGGMNYLDDLKNATKNTVSNLDLMKAAVKANNFQIPLKDLASLFEFATKRAAQTGESVDYLVESIVLGIGRKSPLILDNLGISAVMLIDKLKGVGVEMTTVPQIAEAVGKIAREEMSRMGDVAITTSQRISGMTAAYKELQTQIGKTLTESIAFNDAIDSITELLKQIGKGEFQKKGLMPLLFGSFSKIDESEKRWEEYGEKIKKFLKEQGAIPTPKPAAIIEPQSLSAAEQLANQIKWIKLEIIETNKELSITQAGERWQELIDKVKTLKDQLKALTQGARESKGSLKEMSGATGIAFGTVKAPKTDITPLTAEGLFSTESGDMWTDAMSGTLMGLDTWYDGLSDKIKELKADLPDLIGEFNTELTNLIKFGSMDALQTLTEGLTLLAAGAITGKDFGNQVLKMVGNFMVQLGTLFIISSKAYQAFQTSLATGNFAGMLGAGIALVVAGAAISALAGKGVTGGSGSVGGGAAASGYNPSGSTAGQALSGNVFFELEGVKLKGVLNNVDRRNNVMR